MTNYKKIDRIYKNNYGGKTDENEKMFITILMYICTREL